LLQIKVFRHKTNESINIYYLPSNRNWKLDIITNKNNFRYT
jgi:hypothetical protein